MTLMGLMSAELNTYLSVKNGFWSISDRTFTVKTEINGLQPAKLVCQLLFRKAGT